MARGAGRITRLEVRWWVISAVLGLVVLVVLIGRFVGTIIAEALTAVLLLVPTVWYLGSSIRGKRKAESLPADVPYLTGVGDVPPVGDVGGGDIGGCN